MLKLVNVLLIISANAIFGTAQTPDILFYSGKQHLMFYLYPLNQYLRSHKISFTDRFSQSHPSEIIYDFSNCWRGYIASWTISSNKFYLINLQEPKSNKPVPLSIIFSNASERIFANWYTDHIALIESEKLSYPMVISEMDRHSTNIRSYAPQRSEISITIKEGKIISIQSNIYSASQ